MPSKTNEEFYRISNKYTANKLENYAISKYNESFKTNNVKEKTNNTINPYKPKKLMVHLVIITLNIKVMEVKKTSIEQYLEKIRIYLGDMTDKLKKTGE